VKTKFQEGPKNSDSLNTEALQTQYKAHSNGSMVLQGYIVTED